MNRNVEVYDFEVLTRANQFKKASELLRCSSDTVIPLEVIACFACELYLKYMIYFRKNRVQVINSGQIGRKHNLKNLYDLIDNGDKTKIKERLGSEFESNLEDVKLNFQEIRYEYEYEKVTFSPGFLVEFMDVLSEICNTQ